MVDFLENNIYIVFLGYIIGMILWYMSVSMSPIKKIILRSSLVLLLFPIVYPAHPFLFYQSWMLLFIYVIDLKFLHIFIYLSIWLLTILIPLFMRKLSNS